MQTYQFKTNIKCEGCIAAVSPSLNDMPEIEKWEVDLQNQEKILTVKGEDKINEKIIQTLQKLGYQATSI